MQSRFVHPEAQCVDFRWDVGRFPPMKTRRKEAQELPRNTVILLSEATVLISFSSNTASPGMLITKTVAASLLTT